MQEKQTVQTPVSLLHLLQEKYDQDLDCFWGYKSEFFSVIQGNTVFKLGWSGSFLNSL